LVHLISSAGFRHLAEARSALGSYDVNDETTRMNRMKLAEIVAWWKTFAVGMAKGMLSLSAWIVGGAISLFVIRYPFYNDTPTTYVSWVLWTIGITFCLVLIVMLGFWLFSFRPVAYTVGVLVVLLLLAQCFHSDRHTECIDTRYVSCP
jgi:hypothetical protein